MVSISFWSPKPVVWILLAASSFSVSHASKRHWNKIGKKNLQVRPFLYTHIYIYINYISYNVLKNIPIYNFKSYSPALLQNAAIYEEYLAEGPIVLLSIYRWLPNVFQSAGEKETQKKVLQFTFFFLNKKSCFPYGITNFLWKHFPYSLFFSGICP